MTIRSPASPASDVRAHRFPGPRRSPGWGFGRALWRLLRPRPAETARPTETASGRRAIRASALLALALALQGCTTMSLTGGSPSGDRQANRHFINVYYATDRKNLTDEQDIALHYGRVSAEVTDIRRCDPVVQMVLVRTRPDVSVDDVLDHVILGSAQMLSETNFYAALSGKRVLLFVHGFNNTFEEAIKEAAIIAASTRFSGIPVAYAWPASVNYLRDSRVAAITRANIAGLLQSLLTSDATEVHVVAHSMGSHITMQALYEVVQRRGGPASGPGKMSTLSLFAPDVTLIEAKRFLPDISATGLPVTVYWSDNDSALNAGERMQNITGFMDAVSGRVTDPRIGKKANGVVQTELSRIAFVDATDIDGGDNGHRYYLGDGIAELKRLLAGGVGESGLHHTPDRGWRLAKVTDTKSCMVAPGGRPATAFGSP